jgi:rare lipoprotein A
MRALAAAIAIAALLAGCGSVAKRDAPEPAPRSGGYYKDDGPGASPPPNLAATPDAVPRAEPLNRFANRPYQVFGKDYVPFTSVAPFRQQGVASWYGKRYHGGKTSSGETYDMYAMTAAHTVLPIPSYVRVTSLANGRSVVVRVNDRGPFHNDRVIDLSYTAALKLGMLGSGSALVEVETIVPAAAAAATPAAPAAAAQAAAAPEPPRGVFLQLAAFSTVESAENYRGRVQRELPWLGEPPRVLAAGGLYRVQLGPYRTQDEARPVAERIQSEINLRPLVVVR